MEQKQGGHCAEEFHWSALFLIWAELAVDLFRTPSSDHKHDKSGRLGQGGWRARRWIKNHFTVTVFPKLIRRVHIPIFAEAAVQQSCPGWLCFLTLSQEVSIGAMIHLPCCSFKN